MSGLTWEIDPRDQLEAPEGCCAVDFLDAHEVDGTPYLCKAEPGNIPCNAIALSNEGVISVAGICEALNNNSSVSRVDF